MWSLSDHEIPLQIAYLENLLKVYNDEIKRLQEKELSVDDLAEEDSSYIQEHKLKRKVTFIPRMCPFALALLLTLYACFVSFSLFFVVILNPFFFIICVLSLLNLICVSHTLYKMYMLLTTVPLLFFFY